MVAGHVRQVVAHARYILTTNLPCLKNWLYMTGGRKKGCRKTQVLLYSTGTLEVANESSFTAKL